MLLTVAGDAFLIEAQIDNDENMALRIFQYTLGYAQKTKVVEPKRLTLPDARIIYWETSRKTPDALSMRLIFPDKITKGATDLPPSPAPGSHRIGLVMARTKAIPWMREV
jgi:hypothetical protein